MKRTLKTQIIIQYMIIVIACMMLIPVGLSKILDIQFKNYVEQKVKDSRNDVLYFLQELYIKGNAWDIREMKLISNEFMPWPIFRATIYDVNNKIVFDVRKRRKKALPENIHTRLLGKYYREMDSKSLAFVDKIYIGNTYIGKVRFLCVPFKDRPEATFLTSFKHMLYRSMSFMLLISILLALFMTKRISDPIARVTKRAYEISRGKYKIASDTETSDITEIQTLIDSVERLGAGLEEQDELRKRLMGDIAHELRNPIAVVKAHLEAFEDGVLEATPERVRLVVDEIDRLSALITGVEKLAIIEAENTDILKEKTNLSEELGKTVKVIHPLYKAKGVKLESEIEANIVSDIDIAKIKHVLENLLTNALRYTDKGGTVTLKLHKQNSNNIISVSDTGIGISAKDLPHVFERFYRTDESRTRASGGMGIGLAIVKATVKAHGGTITVESEEGKGSEFKVILPE